MKKKLIYLAVALFCASGGLHACYYDSVATLEIVGDVSLKNDVQPIFDRDCNMSGCHNSNPPAHDPGLVYPETYQNLISGGFINTTAPENSGLYVAVTSGGMPAGRPPLSDNDKKIILTWISQGAKNN